MTDAPAIDDRTASAIRDAMSAAGAGRTAEAVEIGERALADGGDPVALNAMLGSLRCSAGQLDEGVRHLRVAHEARPTDPVIALNLASGLSALGDNGSARSLITDELVRSDKTFRLARMRGYAAQMLDDFAGAIADYEAVVRANPGDWETWNNLGNSRVGAGDLAGGIAALQQAADLNPRVAQTRLNLALALRDAGELAEAEIQLRSMAEDFPHDPTPLTHLFAMLQLQGWDKDARNVLERMLELDPQNVGLLIALGREQLLAFEISEAIQTFRRILKLDPTNPHAFLGLADAFEHDRPDGLPELVAEAQAANVDSVPLNVLRAMAAGRAKQFREGIDALEPVPADYDPVRRWHLAGQLLDGAGEYDAAFDAFSRLNQALADEPTEPLARAAELRAKLRDQLRHTTPEWRDSWVAAPMLANRPAPVFLVGFPRSGTTLLDTMLMGHPKVEVMEERPVLAQMRSEGGDFDAIAGMDEAEVRRLQARYFELAGNYAKLKPETLLVDKSPLHMQHVPQIYRLFPNARFILALRHPADVVLSCFMSKFRLNASMANFVRLDVAAEFYDLAFSMWEQALKLFPVEVHTVVYERLIDDAEGQLKPIVEALELDWQPDMVEHQRAAQSRGIITTASYSQVTEPLYRRAVGRWQHYRKHLEPILPTLQPWIEKLGYDGR
jgi:tetratricopeptide (TPR) repeat protein